MLHYQYSVGATLQSSPNTMNEHFWYQSFVRQLTRQFSWAQVELFWQLSVMDMLWLLFIPIGNEPGFMLFFAKL
jgi:hypothetical protein